MFLLIFISNQLFQTMATPEEQAIQGVIDQIWETYDADKSGALDKEETKKFVQDTLGNLGSGDEFSDEAFDEVFSTFDKDNSGTVEKNEMVVFIKQLLGGQWARKRSINCFDR